MCKQAHTEQYKEDAASTFGVLWDVYSALHHVQFAHHFIVTFQAKGNDDNDDSNYIALILLAAKNSFICGYILHLL